MKIKLTIFERLVASSILPNEGKYHELKHLRETKEAMAMSADEYKQFEPLVTNNAEGKLNAKWDVVNEVIHEKEIDFNEWLFNIIYDELRNLEKNGKLPMEKMTLYEKFVRGIEHDKQDEPDK